MPAIQPNTPRISPEDWAAGTGAAVEVLATDAGLPSALLSRNRTDSSSRENVASFKSWTMRSARPRDDAMQKTDLLDMRDESFSGFWNADCETMPRERSGIPRGVGDWSCCPAPRSTQIEPPAEADIECHAPLS